jgi:WD40 repeat protein/predicted Ser/Thr protein kinase
MRLEEAAAAEAPVVDRDVQAQERRNAVAAALFNLPPAEPLRIGRYTIVRTLGRGGMGVVYLAYDGDLDRRVAVKLLHASSRNSKSVARLQREAMAMARLQHPNVVTVYETGAHEGQLFVAMEYIRGSDMRGWMEAQPRSWREVLDTFLQAGEGLVAAHRAGIVHRDFKPDNVLVGEDGWVRVADFGLAYVERAADSSELPPESPDRAALPDGLTRTGAMMGTPAYMAPEQFRRALTDERTDQFSYCVALWEALYGEQPFPGTTVKELAVAVLRHELAEPPSDSSVPVWLRIAITRGLALEREHRWPSMAELLEVLGNDPEERRTRRRRALAFGTTVVVLLASLGTLAASALVDRARERYWGSFTEDLLEIERARGLAQAGDDASRARDATRMSVFRNYGLRPGTVDHYDPTVAAALLREVETDVRLGGAWISAANNVLGESIAHAILDGHTGTIKDLVFSPDATVLYSAATDGQVWRWDVATATGEPIISHAAAVTKLVLSPDGTQLVSGSADQTVRAWSSETRDATLLTTHADDISALASSPDGRWLLTASRDGEVRLHPRDGGAATVLSSDGSAVVVASFSPSGRWLAIGGLNQNISVWSMDGGEPSTLAGHTDGVYHLEFADDERLVSAADDGDVRLWSLADGQLVETRVISSHGSPVTGLDVYSERVVSAAERGSLQFVRLGVNESPRWLRESGERIWTSVFTPDGERIAFACFDATARLVNIDGSGVERSFVGHPLALLRVAVDAGGRWMATGSYDGSVRIWDLGRPQVQIPLTGHQGGGLVIDADRDRVVTAANDGTTRVWDLDDGSEIERLATNHGPLSAARFRPHADQIALATSQGYVDLWALDTNQLRVLAHEQTSFVQLAFDETGDRLAAANADTTVRIWRLDDGELLAELNGHGDLVSAVDYEPGGARIATASYDGTVRIWSSTSGAELARLHGHENRIQALTRSPDGRTLATASDDATARLWPDDDPANAIVLAGHRQPVWDVAFDGEGKRVVTASTDGTARVWDAHDGGLLAVLEGHSEGVWAARFAPDGRVITVSDDNTVRVWTPSGSRAPIVLAGHRGPVTDLELSTAGDRFVSAASDGTAIIWRLDRLDADPDSLLARLWGVTRHCLTVDQRLRELGEDSSEAQRRRQACTDSLDAARVE